MHSVKFSIDLDRYVLDLCLITALVLKINFSLVLLVHVVLLIGPYWFMHFF